MNATAQPKRQYAISRIVHDVNCTYGAPMGRRDIGQRPTNKGAKIFDRPVPMSVDAGYDKGGAYWGIGKQLRVEYTSDLSYVRFYRAEWKERFSPTATIEVGDTVYYRGEDVVIDTIKWQERGNTDRAIGDWHDMTAVLGAALDWCIVNGNMDGREIRNVFSRTLQYH